LKLSPVSCPYLHNTVLSIEQHMATHDAQDLQLKQYVTNDIDKPNDAFVEEAYQSTYDALQTKRLLRKIDWHLIPFLSLLYLLSFLE